MAVLSDVKTVGGGSLHSQLVADKGENIEIGYKLAEDGSPQASADMNIACVGLFTEVLNHTQIADVLRGCDYGKY